MHCSRSLLLVLGLSACAGPVLASEPPAEAAFRTVTATADFERRQREAIAAMPSVEVEYDETGAVQTLSGDTGLFVSDPGIASMVVDHGADALRVLGSVLQAEGTERLEVRKAFAEEDGERVVHYQESIRGIPVKGVVALAVDAETGSIRSLGARFLPDRGLPVEARLDEREARRLLGEALVGSLFADEGSVETTETPRLSYVRSQEDGQPALVWLVPASYTSPRGGREQREFWVNAQSGRVEGSEALSRPVLYQAYTANNQSPSPFAYPTGLTVSVEPNAIRAMNNLAETEAGWIAAGDYDGIGLVALVVNWSYLPESTHLYRNSVHWLSFGGGSASYQPFGNSRDAVAHEWGHGFFGERTSYSVQSSKEQLAMGEAYADLSAVVVANRFAAGPGTFEIAEDVRNSGVPLRSWSAPQLIDPKAVDWYPLRWIGYDPHMNITIMGHAFYLLSQGGTHYRAGTGIPQIPTINVPGIGFARAADIFRKALKRPGFAGAPSFITLRKETEAQADDEDPTGTARLSVSAAWNAVGVNHGCVAPPSVPTLEIINFMCGGHHILNWAAVPGATTYFAEKVRLGWPWSLAQPATDGPVNTCNQDVPSPFRIRLQSCNGCGCSSFGPAELLQFYQQCL